MSEFHVELGEDGPRQWRALVDPRSRELLDALLERFAGRSDGLLAARGERQRQADAGRLPDFGDVGDDAAGDPWRGAEAPPALEDRRVELFPASTAEALVAAFDSGAGSVTLDLAAVLPARGSALDALALLHEMLATGRAARPAVVLGLRPPTVREPALRWRGAPVPAAVAELALYLCRAAGSPSAAADGAASLRLSGLDSADEAALWAELLDAAVDVLGIGRDALRVTLGIDTVHAAFAAEAMLHALRRYATALTFDRHACLRSFVHTFRRHPQFVLPDADELTTASHFLRSRGLHLVHVAHRRGVSALAPCLPWLRPAADGDGRELARLQAVLERHARDGYDGCGIADVALLGDARDVYERLVPGPQQRHRSRSDVRITPADLLQVVKGKITERGMRHNLRVAIAGYLAVRDGISSLELDGRRETAASVALAADQLWQWVHLETGVLDDGRIVDAELFSALLAQAADRATVPADDLRQAAAALTVHVLERQQPGEFPGDLLQA